MRCDDTCNMVTGATGISPIITGAGLNCGPSFEKGAVRHQTEVCHYVQDWTAGTRHRIIQSD